MKRLAPSMASSFDFNSNCAYPPTTSLASVNGPSITVTFPPESRTRVPVAVGRSPPLPIIVPALTAASLSFPMASINGLGGKPKFSADLTIIMNRIVTSPCVLGLEAEFFCILHQLHPGSAYTSSDRQRNRQLERSFLGLRHAATTATRPSGPSARTCPLHRSAEARTHHRQRPAGNLSLIGWPPALSLSEGWRTRRRLPLPLQRARRSPSPSRSTCAPARQER